MYGFTRRPAWAVTVVTVLAVTAAAGGVAWAATAGSSATTELHGCVNTRTGALRVITPGKIGAAGKCRRHERGVNWNKRGPIGPRGLRGAKGKPGSTGPQGPGAVEYTFSLGVGQSRTLGPGGPFGLSADCTTSAGETVTELLGTNTGAVSFNETTISPGEAPPSDLSMTSASAPPEAVPAELDVIASSSGAERETDRMITPPSAELGQLNDMVYVSSGGCSGSVMWIPASSSP